MDVLLRALGLVALFGGCLVGLASLVIGLPGTLIILAVALGYAWMTGFASVGWGTIGWLALLAAVAEGLEFAASAVATAGAHPSRRATVAAIAGAIVGGLVGTPFLLGLGALLGAIAGAFVGAWLAVVSEGAGSGAAWRAGLAAMKGRLLGFVLKAAVAVVMIALVMLAAVHA
jgi:uncharacterized protein